MTMFTIDENNNITAFGSKEEAAGNDSTALIFMSQKELSKLAADWPVGRLIEIWNSFAGVAPFGELNPVKKFTDRKVAVARIWQAIQRLHVEVASSSNPVQDAEPEPGAEAQAEIPTRTPEPAEGLASVAPHFPNVAPEETAATTAASPAEKVPAADAVPEVPASEQPPTKQLKRNKAAEPVQEAAAPRETKLSRVVAMLQRPGGATITEIIHKSPGFCPFIF
jgi:hypothetical protein